MWLITGLYVATMAVGCIWLIQRIVRYVRHARARREVEAMWAQGFGDGDFQEYLASLRGNQQAASPENPDNQSKGDPEPPSPSTPSS
jgi:hypothetical protein